MLTWIATMEDQVFALNLGVDDAFVEDEDLAAIGASQRVIYNRKVAYFTEFALMKYVELVVGGKKIRNVWVIVKAVNMRATANLVTQILTSLHSTMSLITSDSLVVVSKVRIFFSRRQQDSSSGLISKSRCLKRVCKHKSKRNLSTTSECKSAN